MGLKLESMLSLLCTLLTAVSVTAEKGYLLMSPRNLEMNSVNKLQLHLYELDAPGKIQILLRNTDVENSTILAETEYNIQKGEERQDLDFFVPLVEDYRGKIRINGTFETDDNYSIYGEDTLYLRKPRSQLVFIQTDKANYKPGQQVKFRVLLLNRKLRLAGNDKEGDIWVEDPKNSRLAQWKNVPLGNGMKQLEFPLSEEPNLGLWTIHASIGEEMHAANFEVKEYVLPKFEVVITPPSYVLVNAETIPVEICAKYTYGKPVEGNLTLNVSMEKYGWGREKVPTVEVDADIEGCYKYTINVSLIDTESHYSYRRIEFVALVTEKGTGIEIKATKMIERVSSPLYLNFMEDSRQYFKPGLPYLGKLKVTNPDDTLTSDEAVEICTTVTRERVLSNWWATRTTKFCSNFTSNAEGIVEYTIPPQNVDAVSLTVEARSLNYSEDPTPGKIALTYPRATTNLSPWFSPSGSHLQIQAVNDAIPCGDKKEIKILYTSKENSDYTFYYEVINKGRVVTLGSIDETFTMEDDVSGRFRDQKHLVNDIEIQVVPPPTSSGSSSESEEDCPSAVEARYIPPIGEAILSLDITSDLSPSFFVLVYYIREDRETVADSHKFSVEKCFQNKVELQFGSEVKQPGERTSVTLSASPNSLCGIKVVDKSVSLMDGKDQLTKDEVFSALDRLDDNIYYPINHCNGEIRQAGLGQKESAARTIIRPPPVASSPYQDALTAFENSGNLVISDLTLMTRPCKKRPNSHYPVYSESMDSVGMRVGGAARPVALASTAARRPPAMDADSKMGMFATKSVVELRNYFPETWLFKMELVGEEGERISKEVLPHTITEWQGSAVCVNNEDGLGISDISTIKGFQAFFVSFTLPYSVIRGEKFWVSATVFNYIDKALPITVTLEDTPGYQLVGDSFNGDICIEPEKSTTLRVQVQATSLGTLNFTVRAQTADSKDVCGDADVSEALARDAVQNTLLVEAEGFPQESVDSVMFCPKDEAEDVFKKTFAPDLPEDSVQDSSRQFLILTGDIMGPAIENLDNLVAVPKGCGEQNMVLFTPNVFVLDYLTATGKLTDAIRNKATKNLVTGAQREMKYRHPDGSFSAFGVSDKQGSIFLTSFVMRSFSQADKYISIDYDNLAQTLRWVTSKQQSDGCFPEIGWTVDNILKGGIYNQTSNVPLTAYILSSLIIAGYKNDTALKLALSCISKDDTNMTPYKLSLYAYTAALAGDGDLSKEYLSRLNEKANKTGDTVHFRNIGGSKSIDVETAAYAVLTILKSAESAADAVPIVRWMSKNRNSRGGFYSTQDTVLGLQALSEFGTYISKEVVDLSVAVEGGLKKTVHISEDDKILVREYKIENSPSEVNVEAKGSGCGLMQVVLRYNTNSSPEKQVFHLEVSSECKDDDCKRASIKVCTSYIPEGKSSNMAVVEIKMVSGMLPIKASLDRLVQDNDIELKRFDIENNNVNFYFYELKNDKKCFEFYVEELFEIEDSKPATAKVYDYYARENSASTLYSIKQSTTSSEG